jgi:hypothetical protein
MRVASFSFCPGCSNLHCVKSGCMARRSVFAIVLMGWLFAPSIASAAPPPDADPDDGPIASWYHSLKTPEGGGCCDTSDCRHMPVRIGKNGYEVQVPEPGEENLVLPRTHWITVPPEKILRKKDNPTGEAVTCWSPYFGVLCFVEGTGT